MNREEDYQPTDVERDLLDLLDESDPLETFSASGLPATTERCRELSRSLESWAMLSLALPELEAPAELRSKILRELPQEGAAGATRVADGESAQRDSRDAGSSFTLPPETRSGSRPSWLLPLAASLAVCLFALSGWLWSRLDEQRETIARLQQQVEEFSQLRSEPQLSKLDALEERLALITSANVEICPLKSMVPDGPARAARGVMYVAADHQHWYLAVSGLQPAPAGTTYHLWFFVGRKPISAGSFTAQPGEEIQLGSDTMPEGTRAVGVTIEEGTDVLEPSSPPILFGDQVTRIS